MHVPHSIRLTIQLTIDQHYPGTSSLNFLLAISEVPSHSR